MKERLLIVIKIIGYFFFILLGFIYMLTIIFPLIEWIIRGEKSIAAKMIIEAQEMIEDDITRNY